MVSSVHPSKKKGQRNLILRIDGKSNTALHNTTFTVSIDLVGHGCSTGISAYDRATGIKALVNPDIKAHDFARQDTFFH